MASASDRAQRDATDAGQAAILQGAPSFHLQHDM
jgi:hypothetical protein